MKNEFLKKLVRWLSVIVLIAIFGPSILFMAAMIITGGEDRTFYGTLSDRGQIAAQILVKNNICPAVNRCGGTTWFVGPKKGGGNITLYGVTDAKIFHAFANEFIQEFFKNPSMIVLTIKGYKEAATSQLFSPKPIFEIDLKKNSGKP